MTYFLVGESNSSELVHHDHLGVYLDEYLEGHGHHARITRINPNVCFYCGEEDHNSHACQSAYAKRDCYKRAIPQGEIPQMKLKGMLEEIADMENSVEQCRIYDMTFAPIPEEHKMELKQWFKDNFKIWSDTWILPPLHKIKEEIQKE
ncbi:hypothetical protein LCGC14_2689190, partial [marine sediment metagenome]